MMVYEKYKHQFDRPFTYGDLKHHFLSEGAAFIQDAVYSYIYALIDYFITTGDKELNLNNHKTGTNFSMCT